MESRYTWEQTYPDPQLATHISKSLDIPDAIARALINRGVLTVESARGFMEAGEDNMHDPYLLKDMDLAVERILRALRDHERMLILGDYDVDGISGAALLVSFLESVGGHVKYYIPNRASEGYGLSTEVVRKTAGAGYHLIITVDSGISSLEEARAAKELGLDLIITDHHEPHEEMPCALAVLNPKRADTTYPFRELAGVGVAFKLLSALADRLGVTREKVMERYIELVALGTVGDLVPLLDENRYFVRKGLESMASSRNVGVYALLEVARIHNETRLDTFHISFGLAPRINAAGRIWNPRAGVELLIATSPERARLLASKLDEQNRLRIKEEATTFEEAVNQLADSHDLSSERAIILHQDSWNVGIIGIVASKLMERHHRPVILATLSRQPEDVKNLCPEKGRIFLGSARSVKGFDMYGALKQLSHLFLSYGGHALAAGLKIYERDIPELRKSMGEIVAARMGAGPFKQSLIIDAELTFPEINLELLRKSRLLDPCGEGNPKPVFCCRDLNVLQIRPCGADGRHLQIKLGQGNIIHDAIGFGFCDFLDPEQLLGEHIDIAFMLKEDIYNGRVKPKLNIKDIRISR